ncbi:MAG: endonuclease/exonuclease/phosphatase family protein, partial [Chitinophagaceae bacterium]|nr:endonuclease/exonuclease/phosphatase family protein [Chitinophagaceae bacterium]
ILIFFLLLWLFSKSLWVFVSIITIAIAWREVENIIPFNFSSTFTVQKKTNSIRVMSWNVEQFDIMQHKTHPEVKEKMLELINQFQPDIACFQEMVGGDDDKAINYLGDIKRKLKFKSYYYSYDVRLDFDNDHHFGVLIFSKLPMLKRQTISVYPYDYNSIFQYVDVLANADTLRVFNIHLQSLKFNRSNFQYLDHPHFKSDSSLQNSKNIISKLKSGFLKRSLQANTIKNEMNKSPYPVIICGDFNDVPNSYAYSKIGKNMQNAFVEKGAGIGRTFSKIAPTLRIDNIFTDKNFTIDQYVRIKKELIDHYPIIADITVTSNGFAK